MATKLSMSTKGYAKIERGETRVNFERLEQILGVLNSDIYELLTYGENKGITISTGNNNTNASSNIFLGNDDVEKLNLMLAHKDEIIKLKDDVIESLRNEISLLKEKLSTQQ